MEPNLTHLYGAGVRIATSEKEKVSFLSDFPEKWNPIFRPSPRGLLQTCPIQGAFPSGSEVVYWPAEQV